MTLREKARERLKKRQLEARARKDKAAAEVARKRQVEAEAEAEAETERGTVVEGDRDGGREEEGGEGHVEARDALDDARRRR